MTDILEHEKNKYEQIWQMPSYTDMSPGEVLSPLFMSLVEPKRGERLIDLGCGDGKGGKALAKEGLDVTYLDFVYNKDWNLVPFIEQPLWAPIRVNGSGWKYGYCCDVMEHLPPEKVDDVLKRIFKNCDHCFFSIHFGEDNFRKIVGHPLHLTVKPFVWWQDKMRQYGTVKDARDLIGMGTFYVEGT